MRLGLTLKILFLVGGLVLVMAAMNGISTEKVHNAFVALGIEPGAAGGFQPAGRVLAPGEESRTLCHTRIHSVSFPDQHMVVELKQGMKMTWTVVGPSAPKGRELSYLAIEKWLSQHCQFVARSQTEISEKEAEAQPIARFEFIDGSEWELNRAGASDVLFFSAATEKTFLSSDLLSALSELRKIAQLP